MNKLLLCFIIFPFLISISAKCEPLPDFEIDNDSITFSNESPVEGEVITISVKVNNIGEVAPNRNEDLEVWLFEGALEENPLRIMVKDILLGLKPGDSGIVNADWIPRTGTTTIYAIANPEESDKTIEEKTHKNNYAHRAITASARTFPEASPEKIEQAIKKGIDWIIAQKGKHRRICPQCGSEIISPPTITQNLPTGTQNQYGERCYICQANLKGLPMDVTPSSYWDFGESATQDTSIALLALMGAGVKSSNPVIQDALSFLIKSDWNSFEVYHYAIIIPVLVATGEKEKYFERVQFATNQLVKRQLRVEKGHDPRDDGGWGYGLTADGAHMQYCIYALYAAKQWGIDIPQEVWTRAEKWVRRTQLDNGGWLYNLVEGGSPWAEGAYGSMTATGLMALKMCGAPVNDKQIQKGLEWIKKYYTITSNPGSVHWHYYYLLALERFCDVPPRQEILVGHNWYREMSNLLVAEQKPNGRWVDYEEYFPTTCFALLLLNRAVPEATSPDLSVDFKSIDFSPPSPPENQPVRITTSIVNSGKPLEPETIVDVNFYDGNPLNNGTKIMSQQAIFSGSRPDASVFADWKASPQGLHHIYVYVDPLEKINDSDRRNNIAHKDLIVKAADYNPMEDKSIFEKIDDGVYRLGNVILDKNSRKITMPGKVNMVSGIIEFLACNEMGRTHESLLILDIEPIHLQLSLITLGLKPGHNLRYQGDPRIPKGDEIKIWVEWEIAGKKEKHRAEELVLNRELKKPMQKTNWVFTGSRVVNNTFTAQRTKSIIATMRDPDSIINHPLQGGTNTVDYYHANPDVLPPRGTEVEVTITPAS